MRGAAKGECDDVMQRESINILYIKTDLSRYAGDLYLVMAVLPRVYQLFCRTDLRTLS
jgi:hypothetical protein